MAVQKLYGGALGGTHPGGTMLSFTTVQSGFGLWHSAAHTASSLLGGGLQLDVWEREGSCPFVC